MSIGTYVLIAIVVLAILFAQKAIVIIPQSETRIIERLGRYFATLQPGINIIIPFIDRAKEMVAVRRGRYVYTNIIDLREQVYDFDRQNVITKDNIQMQINALLYFQIMDPFKAVYEINNLPNAIEKLTQTTLRNIIGEMELDQTLTSRDTINTKLRSVLDDATNKWGIKVNRVELQDIHHQRVCCKQWRNRCRQNVINVRQFSPVRVKNKQPYSSRKVKRHRESTVLRLTDSRLYSLQRVRLKHEYVLLKLKLWQFRKSRTLLGKAQTLQITSLHRSISR